MFKQFIAIVPILFRLYTWEKNNSVCMLCVTIILFLWHIRIRSFAWISGQIPIMNHYCGLRYGQVRRTNLYCKSLVCSQWVIMSHWQPLILLLLLIIGSIMFWALHSYTAICNWIWEKAGFHTQLEISVLITHLKYCISERRVKMKQTLACYSPQFYKYS